MVVVVDEGTWMIGDNWQDWLPIRYCPWCGVLLGNAAPVGKGAPKP